MVFDNEKMCKLFYEILTSDDVALNFYNCYLKPEFRKWINSVLPEVEDCRRQEQDNPWHIYNCLDHILHSVEEINKLTKGKYSLETRRELAITMFFHDLGKPKCHTKRYSEAFGREVDSFRGHNLESEKIFHRVADNLQIDKTKEKIIGALIKEHDIFSSITIKDDGNKYHKVLSKELIDEMVNEFNKYGNGAVLMKYLILIAKADNLAQNPKLTRGPLTLINKAESYIDKIIMQTERNSM